MVAPAPDAATPDAATPDAPASTDAPVATDVLVSDGPMRAAMGEPCTVGDDTTCADGLICLQGPAGGAVGFCTHTCPATSSSQCAGTPAGTIAFCVVTDADAAGDKACAFLCRIGTTTYHCPGALNCETTEDPPGSNQYLCLP